MKTLPNGGYFPISDIYRGDAMIQPTTAEDTIPDTEENANYHETVAKTPAGSVAVDKNMIFGTLIVIVGAAFILNFLK